MFSRREKSSALLFEFKNPTITPIHSFFVFYSFLAIWLDTDDKIIEMKIVRPWIFSVKPKKKFIKLIEVPVSLRYSKIL